MRNRMVNSESYGEQRSLRAARSFANSITSTCLLAAICALLFGGAVKASAADNVTWTPYAGNPNGNATFEAYPGGQSGDNTIILTITGPDILQGTQFGQHLSISGANSAQFQEDTNITPFLCGNRERHQAHGHRPVLRWSRLIRNSQSKPWCYRQFHNDGAGRGKA